MFLRGIASIGIFIKLLAKFTLGKKLDKYSKLRDNEENTYKIPEIEEKFQ